MMREATIRTLLAAVAATVFLSATPERCSAANHAVLVGASDYSFDGVNDLQGPPNDVRMMREVLMEKGVPADNMTVLADAVEGALRPTRAAIMSALNDLVDRLDPDSEDFVTLYFSGHGTRQPDDDGDELDGLDEVFLPVDIDRWNGEAGTEPRIVNAIVDDEIGEIVSRLRAKNATVWVIMDSCHSGSGTRLAQSGVRARRVRGADLGIETETTITVEERDDFTAPSAGLKGGFVAFFAAQAFQEAIEVTMESPDDAASKQWYGLFTAHLWKRLKSDQTLSFSQLYEAVRFDIEKYQASRGGSQWPAWEGDKEVMARFPLAHGTSTDRTWRLRDRTTIDAGQLHGLRDGAVLAVYEDPADGDEDRIGYIQIRSASALTAKFKTIEYPCSDTNSGLFCERASAGNLPKANYARLVEPALDVVLRLSAPMVLGDDGEPTPPSAEHAGLVDALDAVRQMPKERLGLTILFDQDPFHVSVGFRDGRIWFADSAGFRRTGVAGVPSSIAWPPEAGGSADPRSLARLLVRLGKAHNLAAVARELNDGLPGRLPEPMPLDVKVTVIPSDRAALAHPSSQDLLEECETIERLEEVEIEQIGGNLTQCDTIRIELTKRGDAELDVTVLYKDARGAIHPVFPTTAGQNRIESNRPKQLNFFEYLCALCSDEGDGPEIWSFGAESLYVVAAVADGSSTLDLSHLAQDALSQVTRGAAPEHDQGLSNALTDLVLGGQRTRGALGGGLDRKLWIKTVSWMVWPRQAMLREASRD